MKLMIDGRTVEAMPGQSLLELVKAVGLDCESLAEKPLAAKIAGEVFTLNYIPVRVADAQVEQPSTRRAMAASGGVVRLLRYRDDLGHEAYIRTAQFAIFLAMRQLWPKAVTKMNCTIGASVYMKVCGIDDFDAAKLKVRVAALAE